VDRVLEAPVDRLVRQEPSERAIEVGGRAMSHWRRLGERRVGYRDATREREEMRGEGPPDPVDGFEIGLAGLQSRGCEEDEAHAEALRRLHEVRGPRPFRSHHLIEPHALGVSGDDVVLVGQPQRADTRVAQERERRHPSRIEESHQVQVERRVAGKDARGLEAAVAARRPVASVHDGGV
jgi:hypothetical protein